MLINLILTNFIRLYSFSNVELETINKTLLIKKAMLNNLNKEIKESNDLHVELIFEIQTFYRRPEKYFGEFNDLKANLKTTEAILGKLYKDVKVFKEEIKKIEERKNEIKTKNELK